MSEADLEKAVFKVRDIKAVPIAFWSDSDHAAVVMHDAFFALQKGAAAAEAELAAWHSAFGTSQLSHALAERDALRARVKELEFKCDCDPDPEKCDCFDGPPEGCSCHAPVLLIKWHERANKAEARAERMEAALIEIQEGAGPFSRDPLQHASNTIEAMKKLAREALAPEPAP